MDFKTLMSTLFGFSAPTFYSWKKEQRPIISLLDKYFTKEDLVEFLEMGKIDKMENINYLATDFPFFIKSIFHHIIDGKKNFELFTVLPPVIVEFSKNNISPYNIINDFLEFLNKLDFSSIISMDGYKFDQNELKLYLAYRVSKVSILEFYMLVKNINLLQLNDEEDV